VRSDECAVVDPDSRWDERKRLDLDVPAENGAPLDLDERGNLAPVADLAAVEVHQLRVRDDDAPAQGDAGEIRPEPSHLLTSVVAVGRSNNGRRRHDAGQTGAFATAAYSPNGVPFVRWATWMIAPCR
jgi:hypothetical protein